jgi:hypothetical protein
LDGIVDGNDIRNVWDGYPLDDNTLAINLRKDNQFCIKEENFHPSRCIKETNQPHPDFFGILDVNCIPKTTPEFFPVKFVEIVFVEPGRPFTLRSSMSCGVSLVTLGQTWIHVDGYPWKMMWDDSDVFGKRRKREGA